MNDEESKHAYSFDFQKMSMKAITSTSFTLMEIPVQAYSSQLVAQVPASST
jgi:hypothetical protein